MDFEILQSAKGFLALFVDARIGFFARMHAHVDQQLVPGVELLLVALAVGPETKVAIFFARILIHVLLLQVLDELLHVVEGVAAVFPLANTKLVRFQLLLLLLVVSSGQFPLIVRRPMGIGQLVLARLRAETILGRIVVLRLMMMMIVRVVRLLAVARRFIQANHRLGQDDGDGAAGERLRLVVDQMMMMIELVSWNSGFQVGAAARQFVVAGFCLGGGSSSVARAGSVRVDVLRPRIQLEELGRRLILVLVPPDRLLMRPIEVGVVMSDAELLVFAAEHNQVVGIDQSRVHTWLRKVCVRAGAVCEITGLMMGLVMVVVIQVQVLIAGHEIGLGVAHLSAALAYYDSERRVLPLMLMMMMMMLRRLLLLGLRCQQGRLRLLHLVQLMLFGAIHQHLPPARQVVASDSQSMSSGC